jgi:hypothetical protein
MSAKKFAMAALAAATSLSSVALAAPPAPSHHGSCVLAEHRVTKVTPLRVMERSGRGASERLVGAQVFVQAEPGLTAEWLQLSIQRHITQMNSAMPNCPLDAKDVRVSVNSAGPGFAVQIAGKDAAQAKEILRRAQSLVP